MDRLMFSRDRIQTGREWVSDQHSEEAKTAMEAKKHQGRQRGELSEMVTEVSRPTAFPENRDLAFEDPNPRKGLEGF